VSFGTKKISKILWTFKEKIFIDEKERFEKGDKENSTDLTQYFRNLSRMLISE